MSQKQINQWRSVGFAFLVLAVLSTVLLWTALAGKVTEGVVTMYGSLCVFSWITTLAAFGKSLGEKAAIGPGFQGIAKVLMTDAKPGDEPKKEP